MNTCSLLSNFRQVAHNRLWLFEAVDVNMEDINDSPNPPPAYESSRYSEITAQDYHLKNIGTGYYVNVAASPWRFYPYNGRANKVSPTC